MLDGRSPSGHGHVGEVRETLEGLAVRQQHLAAPDGPILTVACAVEGDAADGISQPMLGHNRHDVGMMVLHLGHGKSLVMGPFACEILGVQVACHRWDTKPSVPRSSVKVFFCSGPAAKMMPSAGATPSAVTDTGTGA